MQRVRGGSQPQAEPVQQGEVRWIERLQQQQQKRPAPSRSEAVDAGADAAEAGAWILRLQDRTDSAV